MPQTPIILNHASLKRLMIFLVARPVRNLTWLAAVVPANGDRYVQVGSLVGHIRLEVDHQFPWMTIRRLLFAFYFSYTIHILGEKNESVMKVIILIYQWARTKKKERMKP